MSKFTAPRLREPVYHAEAAAARTHTVAPPVYEARALAPACTRWILHRDSPLTGRLHITDAAGVGSGNLPHWTLAPESSSGSSPGTPPACSRSASTCAAPAGLDCVRRGHLGRAKRPGSAVVHAALA